MKNLYFFLLEVTIKPIDTPLKPINPKLIRVVTILRYKNLELFEYFSYNNINIREIMKYDLETEFNYSTYFINSFLFNNNVVSNFLLLITD